MIRGLLLCAVFWAALSCGPRHPSRQDFLHSSLPQGHYQIWKIESEAGLLIEFCVHFVDPRDPFSYVGHVVAIHVADEALEDPGQEKL